MNGLHPLNSISRISSSELERDLDSPDKEPNTNIRASRIPGDAKSADQLRDFLEKVKRDSVLQDELGGASADEVVAIAKSAGCVITADQIFKPAVVALENDEDEYLTGGEYITSSNLTLFGFIKYWAFKYKTMP